MSDSSSCADCSGPLPLATACGCPLTGVVRSVDLVEAGMVNLKPPRGGFQYDELRLL